VAFKLTDEQRAIKQRAESTRLADANILIEALAGTGKTFALLEVVEALPRCSVLMCAFNKRIATTLEQRMPKGLRAIVKVSTFHSIGLSIIKQHYKHLSVNAGATEELITRAADGRNPAYPVRRAANRLLRQIKEVTVDRNGGYGESYPLDEAQRIGLEFDIFGKMTEGQIEQACELAIRGYDLSLQPDQLESIDFCDMIWLPIALNLAITSRYKVVIIDEWQDLSEPQFELIRKLVAPGGRLIMAGDRYQAIYDWRGAKEGIVRETMLGQAYNAISLPLTTTWRCARLIVNEANTILPGASQLKAAPGAIDGTVSRTHICKLATMLPRSNSDSVFVLSRNNEALLQCALQLWKDRVAFQLNAAREILDPLLDLLDHKLDTTSGAKFHQSLNAWKGQEIAKAVRAGAMAYEARVCEQHMMLAQAALFAEPSKIRSMLVSILQPNQSGILLSSVHKVKGLEADRVYLLEQTFARHQEETRLFKAFSQEEANIEYVAITRAREHLIWVDMRNETRAANQIGGGTLAGRSKAELQQMFEECEREAERLQSVATDDAAEKAAAAVMSRAQEILAYMRKHHADK
jgi:DNA helicase-2/ATP-dependent DNA helicase PcrA